MQDFKPIQTVDRNSGALVFHEPDHVKKQREAAKKAEKVDAENQGLKALLGAMIEAMPANQRSKLPEELVSMVKPADAQAPADDDQPQQ